MVLPVHAVAVATNGDLDIEGFAATSLPLPGSGTTAHRSHRSYGGGFGGGFGGFGGGFGGRGGSREGGGGSESPRATAPPIDLDIHVSGHIAHNSLTRMTIAETRHAVLDGLTYTNAGNWTIDVLR